MASDNPSIRQKAVTTLIHLMKLKEQISNKAEKSTQLSPVIFNLIQKIVESNSEDVEPEFYDLINDNN